MQDLSFDLREDLENDLLTVYYQPIIDIESEKIVSAEALIRWNHRLHGNIPAAKTIEIAEASGLIFTLGEWVLKKSCQQLSRWHDQGLFITIAVNISPRQLDDLDIRNKVISALRETNLAPRYLVLEITETENLFHYSHAFDSLSKLADIGVKLSIDDFGVGYASVAYLTRMNFHLIKIDRFFIKEISSRTSQEIVNSMVMLAARLNIAVIVEGVENECEKEILKQINCKLMQGYLFSEPLESEEFQRRFIKDVIKLGN